MIRLGLIGYPLGHSLSPIIHAAALEFCGLEGSYSLFPIHPDDKQGLQELLDRVRNGEIRGLNVTIPHKQNVIEFLDELTLTAQAIGAVNTVYMRENRLIGENTDAPGFLADLKKFLITMIPKHKDQNALIIGAGGSARAVIYALINDGWEVIIAARRLDQAQQLADSFANYHLRITNYSLTNLQSPISLIVNTTPVGMTPNLDQSPWHENLPLPPHAVVYDLVYNPRETKFVRDAHSQGRLATAGLGMLIEQAALAFEIWTGHRPSRRVMFASATQSLITNY